MTASQHRKRLAQEGFDRDSIFSVNVLLDWNPLRRDLEGFSEAFICAPVELGRPWICRPLNFFITFSGDTVATKSGSGKTVTLSTFEQS